MKTEKASVEVVMKLQDALVKLTPVSKRLYQNCMGVKLFLRAGPSSPVGLALPYNAC